MWARPTRAPSTWRAPAVPRSCSHELDHLTEAGRAERLALREQPAGRVHRAAAAERGVARVEDRRAARRARRARAPPTRAAPGPRRCPGTRRRRRRPARCPASAYASLRGERARRGDRRVVDARERCRLAEHAAGQVRAQHGRCERHPARGAAVAFRSTTAAAPSFGEQSMKRWSGSQTSRDPSTSSAVTSLRNIAFGLCTPVAPVLHHDAARSSLVRPDSRMSRCARSAKYAGVAASPASSRHGSKKLDRMMPFGIFSMPNTSTQSYWPARIAPAASWSAAAPLAHPASMSTIGMPVSASVAEHLVAGGDPGVRGAAERGLEVAAPDAGLGERRAHRGDAHVGDGAVLEPAERMDADAGDLDRDPRSRRELPGLDRGAVVVGVQRHDPQVHRETVRVAVVRERRAG